MASSSDSDDSSSSDNDDDSVFYDANDSLSYNETATPFQEQPRWRLSSKNDVLNKPEHFCTIALTEDQLHDIERRDKLQRLRAHEQENTTTKTSNGSSASGIIEHESNDEDNTSTTVTDNQINIESIRRQKKHSVPSIRSNQVSSDEYPSKYSLPYSTLPASLLRSKNSKRVLSASSEPNMIDLNIIDRITKFGEISPNSRKLNDDEILRQPIVHNLDNGKYIPLSDANPMTQTIMERVHGTNSIMSFNSNNNLNRSESTLSRQKHKNNDNDNESTSSASSSTKSSQTTILSLSTVPTQSTTSTNPSSKSIKKQLTKLVMKNFLRRGKTTKTYDQQNPEYIDDEEEDGERLLINDGSNGDLKYKASRYLKEQAQFDRTQLLQTIVNAHEGPIWCMRFSPDGHLLATCGQDCLLKVWVLKSTQPYFDDFSHLTSNASKQQNEILTNRFKEFHEKILSEPILPTINAKLGLNEVQGPLFAKPFCELVGHQAPVLDVAWSKSLFLLSSSMDKTVRLWHLSRLECLCFFRHVDFVSAIAFHPRDDRYFVSASLDGHVRLWNIPDKRVVFWSLIPAQASSQITAAQANLITAVNFCDDGRKVTVGTFDGRFLLYNDSLQYDTVMNIGDKDGSRSHRSRKKRRKPYKITGIESMNTNTSKVLITSNDSRIRVYDIRSKEIERKYRGYSNQSSQIRASFSHDDQFIISGSEDSWFYIWRTEPCNHGTTASANTKLTRKQRRYFDRAFERIRVHNTMVTSAIFAPNPVGIMNYLHSSTASSPLITRSNTPITTPNINNRTRLNCMHAASHSIEEPPTNGPIYVMVTADSKGQLKLLVNRYHR